MSESLAVRAWRSHFPAMDAPLPAATERRLYRGAWDGTDFALSDTLALVGVEWFGPSQMDLEFGEERGSVWMMAFCGIHEDAEETEWARLSPQQARAIARALNRAAKLAEAAPESVATPPANASEGGEAVRTTQKATRTPPPKLPTRRGE